MDYIEVSAKTVEDALEDAQVKLGVTSDQIEYEVLEKGSTGFLGIGNKPALIRVWKKEMVEDAPENAEEAEVPETDTEEPLEEEMQGSVSGGEEGEVTEEVTGPDAEEKSREDLVACAGNFLKEVLANMGFDDAQIRIEMEEDGKSMDVEISGSNMGILIGKRGQTLDSLQYLVSLVVNRHSDSYVRVKLDTEEYRARRKETLENLARNIAYKVKKTRRPVSLEPMNPYERRIIHFALQNDPYVTTYSEGEEPYRHVIVTLKDEDDSEE